jgi:hypothetical protein
LGRGPPPKKKVYNGKWYKYSSREKGQAPAKLGIPKDSEAPLPSAAHKRAGSTVDAARL